MSELVPYEAPALSAQRSVGERLVDAFLAGRSEHTRRAYGEDLDVFAAYLGQPTSDAAMHHLLALSAGQANGVVLSYRASMLDRGLTPSTVNRRLSAIRSAVKLARTLGMTVWTPEINGVKVQTFRDTAGPGLDGVSLMIEKARGQQGVAAARDEALLSLMFDMGLRRGEVVGLDVDDLLRDSKRLMIKGKGKAQKAPCTIPDPTMVALHAWLAVRSQVALAGERALFVGFAVDAPGKRMTGRGLHYLVSELGRRVGIATRPHGLRHAAVTDVLEATNGNIESAQKFARHASPATTMKYNDNRKDAAGEAARLIAARRMAKRPPASEAPA